MVDVQGNFVDVQGSGQGEHRMLTLSPQRGLKSAASKIWTISCDNPDVGLNESASAFENRLGADLV